MLQRQALSLQTWALCLFSYYLSCIFGFLPPPKRKDCTFLSWGNTSESLLILLTCSCTKLPHFISTFLFRNQFFVECRVGVHDLLRSLTIKISPWFYDFSGMLASISHPFASWLKILKMLLKTRQKHDSVDALPVYFHSMHIWISLEC